MDWDKSQEEAGSSWLSQQQSPSCPQRCQQAQSRAELVSRVPHVLHGWGTAQQQDGGAGPEQFYSADTMQAATKLKARFLAFFFSG